MRFQSKAGLKSSLAPPKGLSNYRVFQTLTLPVPSLAFGFIQCLPFQFNRRADGELDTHVTASPSQFNLAGEAAVIRQTSNHDETIRKTENRAKVMSTVDMFSSGIGAKYARKMVELESRGQGDQLNALDRVGREVGLKARALRRIINGETTPSLAVFGRIRAGYLNLCERHIERLRHEVETDKARYGDALFQDIDDEVKALAEKLRAAKETATQGR